jgi:hypothetical protein
VSNAIKFTSKGKVTVAVDLFQEDEHNIVVLKFSIKDTGIYLRIKLEVFSKIFNKLAELLDCMPVRV